MDPLYLWVTLALTVVLFFACAANTGADVPAAAGHGHGDAHGHAHQPDDSPHGEPGEVAHPHEH